MNVPVKDDRGKPGSSTSRGMGKPSARAYRQVYIGLGSNIDPVKNLDGALKMLARHVIIDEVSQTWETPAVGSHGPNFLNSAARIRTQLPPELLKSLVLRRIERELGRVRTANKNAPRTIDLDVLVYEGQVLDPKIWVYAFLAVPLAELLPGLQNPDTGETLEQAANRLAGGTYMKVRTDIASGEITRDSST